MIFYFFLVWKARVIVSIKNEGELGGIENLLIVVIKVDLLPRYDIRKV